LKRIFLSAGLGSEYIPAINRLQSQIRRLFREAKFVSLTAENLSYMCPITFQKYGDVMKEETRGFGYFAWKPEVILRAVSGEFGVVDEVIWIDAGCEVNSFITARRKFSQRSDVALSKGLWTHALYSAESEFTKKEVLSHYLASDPNPKIQFQANYMHFSTSNTSALLEKWLEMTLFGIENLDFKIRQKQDTCFKEHRNDQSLFSIACKTYSVSPDIFNLTTGRGISLLRSLNEPVWISRNRTGISIIPRFMAS
jgi:hypothetical protein